MATDSLIIKDGAGDTKALSAFSGTYGFIPEHVISGTVSVTASTASPVAVTGTVSVSNPVDVTVTVADIISVTSSIAAPLYVSSSANSPLLVTASNNLPVTVSSTITVTSSDNNPLLVTAFNPLPVSIGSAISVTSSIASPVIISASNPLEVQLTSSLVDNNRLKITGSVSADFGAATLVVTASQTNPVYVTGNVTVSQSVTVTSSNASPVITAPIKPTNALRDIFSVFGVIDYTNATSGTFEIASADSSRKGLVIFNPSANDLYINIGSGSTNGFTLANTASAPNGYSFILYSSGTYFADERMVNLFHAGFFPSASNSQAIAYVTRLT